MMGLLFQLAGMPVPAAHASAARCGNGIVEAGEECEPGSPLGSPYCDTACRSTDFEPPGLPFGVPMSQEHGDHSTEIFMPGLACKKESTRYNARNLPDVTVRYRIHLCRTAAGVDAFSEMQVRSVMAKAAVQFAKGGIKLEEESLVRFGEIDCLVSMADESWADALIEKTPPGVLSVTFVTGISSPTAQFAVGGYCYFFGPICVNAGAYDTLVVHELGHFFGLAHTFECAFGSETPSTCGDNGDFICDTPADRGPLGVNGIALCENGSLLNGSCQGTCQNKTCTDGSHPDAYDWMSYYHCTPGHFTNEQYDFMRCTLDHELKSYNADTFTTTTTLPDEPECGDMNGDGELTASDALGVLRAGIGLVDCDVWQCDFDGSGGISASDALQVLRAAIGSGNEGQCPQHL